MPRPISNRIVHEPPLFTEFKPIGIPVRSLEQVKLSLDEYEAIRLADRIGLSHEEAAEEMGISRSTFSRLIEKSRKNWLNLFSVANSLQLTEEIFIFEKIFCVVTIAGICSK